MSVEFTLVRIEGRSGVNLDIETDDPVVASKLTELHCKLREGCFESLIVAEPGKIILSLPSYQLTGQTS